MTQINIRTAETHLAELIQRVIQGEEIIIAQDDEPVEKLTAIRLANKKRCLGTAKGLFSTSADFDEPLEDFKDYI